jgi:branched-chain amino acid transport system ATP-binding protein
MLEIKDIHTYIGESHILQGISMEVAAGKVVALLGRNGVGKTTLMHSIIGFHHVRKGSILFEGREISDVPTHKIVRLGISLVPQGRRIFPSLTVKENLEVPYKGSDERRPAWDMKKIFDIFPVIETRKANRGDKLSGGEQQMLTTGRALVCQPKLLLMDEPSEGLAPLAVRDLAKTIKVFRDQGLTILLVEQKFSFALELADYVHIMSKGKIVYHSIPDDLRKNEEVKARYLGI